MTNPFKFSRRASLVTATREASYGLNIRAKILVGLVVLSLVPMLIFGCLDIRNSRQARELDFTRMELEHARSILQSIEIHFDSEIDHIQTAVRQRIAPSLARGDFAKLSAELQLLGSTTDFECVSMVDLAGKVSHSSCPTQIGADMSKQSWLQGALRGQPAYGMLQPGPKPGSNVMPLAVPVFRDVDRKEQIGIVVVLYRWSEINNILSRFEVSGKPQTLANHVMLTERSGLVIWCYDPAEILTHHLIEAGMTSALQAREGREGYAYETTEHGIPSLSVYTHSKAEPGKVRPEWLLVVLNDPDEVFATVNERSRYFFLLLAGMGVLLVLMASWISASIAKPIRAVTEAINHFKDDATGTKVTLRASGEARVLANAFNEMIDRIVQSKRELRETWDLHQSILKTATAGFWLVSSDDRLVEVNQSYCLMSGYTEPELLGMRIGDLQPSESPVNAVHEMKMMLANGQNRFEAQHRRKDGSTFDVEISTQVLLHREGWLVVFIQDISARKKADQLLLQSLHDKRALLKEVHHRVKNNLQVITSLLRLEASRSAVADTKQVLGYMRGRIRTMAQLHAFLYRSGTLASVDLGVYLGKVATEAFKSQELHHDSVQLTLKLGSVEAGMDQATVAGLLLNELISNGLKHGLPEGRAGEVCVELQPVHDENTHPDGRWYLRVSDNGVGLSPDFEDKRNASLGMQLVTDLSNQLGGTLVIDSATGQGVRFTVVFTVQVPTALVMPP